MEIVYSFTDFRFWLFFLWFLPVIFLAFYIPGSVLIREKNFSQLQHIALCFIMGLVFFALQAFILGYLGLRWLTYGYLLLFLCLWIWQKGYVVISKKNLLIKKIDPLLVGIVILGVVIQLLTVWFIGYRSENGFEFCCFWPDSFYHLALINELSSSFPPKEPGMYDVFVKNYHFLANLVVADLSRVFRLPIVHAQYQYMPVFLSFLLAGSVIGTAGMISQNKNFMRWLVFFLFFSGDIIFVLLFFMGKGMNFTLNVSENATTLWFSPPRVYAMVILFGGIMVFLSFLKKQSLRTGVLLGMLFGSLVGFKIYLGFFALIGLSGVMLFSIFRKRFEWVLPVLVSGIVGALLYFPVNAQAGGLFYSGLWRIDDFAVRPVFDLVRLELAKQVYREHGNYLRIVLIEILFFALYIFSLFGMFLLGFIQSKKSLKEFPRELHVLLLTGLATSSVIGMFFLQDTGGANTLQFLFSVYIVGAFYTALALSYWLKKIPMPMKIALIVLLVLLSSARVLRETYYNITDVVSHKDYFVVSNEQREALEYIKNSIPKDAVVAVESEQAFDDNCYILSFIADRRFFLCGSGILQDHGANITTRVREVETIFLNENITRLSDSLKRNNIDYIYVPSGFLFGTTQTRDFLIPVYKNAQVEVLRVDNAKMKDL